MLSRLPRSDNRSSVTPRKHVQRPRCREARFKNSDPWRFACFRGGADRALSPRGSRETMAPAREHATLATVRLQTTAPLSAEPWYERTPRTRTPLAKPERPWREDNDPIENYRSRSPPRP